MLGIDGAVHQQLITFVDTDAGHRVALHPKDEGRLLVSDQVLVEVNALARVVGRRRRKASRHLPFAHLQVELGLGDKEGLRGGNGSGFHLAEYTV